MLLKQDRCAPFRYSVIDVSQAAEDDTVLDGMPRRWAQRAGESTLFCAWCAHGTLVDAMLPPTDGVDNVQRVVNPHASGWDV